MEKYIEQLKPFLAEVTSKIGEGATSSWYIIVKQQYVTASLGLLGVLGGIIGVFLIVWFMRKTIKDGSLDGELIPMFIFIIGICLFGIIGGGIHAITHFINPEYYALEFFINLVKHPTL